MEGEALELESTAQWEEPRTGERDTAGVRLLEKTAEQEEEQEKRGEISDLDEDQQEDDASASIEKKGGKLTRPVKFVLLLTAFIDILGFSLPNPLMPY
jgi:hypothetical protein